MNDAVRLPDDGSIAAPFQGLFESVSVREPSSLKHDIPVMLRNARSRCPDSSKDFSWIPYYISLIHGA